MNQLKQYAFAKKARIKRIKIPGSKRKSPDLIMMLRDGRVVLITIDIEIITPMKGKPE